MQTLKNEFITIGVNSLGAELVSLRKNNEDYEYMWSGDERYWTGRSPVLFPIVGSVHNEKTIIEGKEFQLKNHGFARRSEFELVEEAENKHIYELKYNDATMAMYPYKFVLRLIYLLEGTSVKITYEVKSVDDKPIYFQLGTHPGFMCPFDAAHQLTDYYLEFSQQETLTRYFASKQNLIIHDKQAQILTADSILPLSAETFYDGALIFRDIRSSSLTLKNRLNERFVCLSWENFPYLGVWQPKDAPFLCLEPWHGLGNTDNSNVEFKYKEQIVELAPQQKFEASIQVNI